MAVDRNTWQHRNTAAPASVATGNAWRAPFLDVIGDFPSFSRKPPDTLPASSRAASVIEFVEKEEPTPGELYLRVPTQCQRQIRITRESAQKENANLISQTGLYLCRQRPEFILSLSKGSRTLWRVQYHRPCGPRAQPQRSGF